MQAAKFLLKVFAMWVLFLIGVALLSPQVQPPKPSPLDPTKQYHIYKFSKSNCPACVVQANDWRMQEIDQKLAAMKVRVFNLDTTQNAAMVQAWQVSRVPTTIFVELTADGKKAKRLRRSDGRIPGDKLVEFIDLSIPFNNPGNK